MGFQGLGKEPKNILSPLLAFPHSLSVGIFSLHVICVWLQNTAAVNPEKEKKKKVRVFFIQFSI